MKKEIQHQRYIRMQSVASVKQMQALNVALKSLTKTWLEAGYDKNDIEGFLRQRTKETVNVLVQELVQENVEMIKADLEAQDISMGDAKI